MTEMIEGKSLKFKDAVVTPATKRTGIVFVNGARLNASELTYNVDVTPDKDSILTITDDTGEKQYRFVMKHGLGGAFGLSVDVKNFLKRIDEETKISEKYVRIEKEIDDFNNDRHDMYDRIDGLDNVLIKGEQIALAADNVDFCQEGTGTLVCTNVKLVFIGSMTTVTIPLDEIAGIEELSDGILVFREGATKKYTFRGIRGSVWAAGVRSMCRKYNQCIEKVIEDFNNDRHDMIEYDRGLDNYVRKKGELFDTLDLNPNQRRVLDNYVLKKGEQFALVADNVDFYQEKTQRVRATRSSLEWFVLGEPPLVKTECYTHMDTGTLVCTNQRLVFIGSMKTVTISLGKIVGINEHSDAIEVSKEGVTKKYAFSGIRGGVWAAGVRSMCREFNR